MRPGADHILWLLISSSLVMLTIPGVALFYGGMVRKKNVLNTIAMPFGALVMVSIEWLCLGDVLVYGRAGEGSAVASLRLRRQASRPVSRAKAASWRVPSGSWVTANTLFRWAASPSGLKW